MAWSVLSNCAPFDCSAKWKTHMVYVMSQGMRQPCLRCAACLVSCLLFSCYWGRCWLMLSVAAASRSLFRSCSAAPAQTRCNRVSSSTAGFLHWVAALRWLTFLLVFLSSFNLFVFLHCSADPLMERSCRLLQLQRHNTTVHVLFPGVIFEVLHVCLCHKEHVDVTFLHQLQSILVIKSSLYCDVPLNVMMSPLCGKARQRWTRLDTNSKPISDVAFSPLANFGFC